MECTRLRVQDIDFDYQQITVREAKGNKQRVVPLPEKLIPLMHSHLSQVKSIHDGDLAAGFGEVLLPVALARKMGAAAKSFSWQYVFPATRLAFDYRTGKTRRHHIHETSLQKAIRHAAKKANFTKKVTSHTLRHYKIHPCILPFRPAKRCSNFLQENLVLCYPFTGIGKRYSFNSGAVRSCRY